MYTEFYAETWFGFYGPQQYNTSNFHKTTKFRIILNRTKLEFESPNFRQSVAAHEFGHSFGLGHTWLPALMNLNRDRNVIYTPQSDDIDGATQSWLRLY